jgi:hypothetical protein
LTAEFGHWLAGGFAHVWSGSGLHHLVFVAVLAASFDARYWRAVAVLLSGFTVAHGAVLAAVAARRLPDVSPGLWSEGALWGLVVAAAATNVLGRVRRRQVTARPASAVGALRADVREGPSSAAHFGWDGPLEAGGLRVWRYALIVAFGIVHGFTAAAAVRQSVADAGVLVVPVLAFDLGIEMGQWVAAAVVVVAAGSIGRRTDG